MTGLVVLIIYIYICTDGTYEKMVHYYIYKHHQFPTKNVNCYQNLNCLCVNYSRCELLINLGYPGVSLFERCIEDSKFLVILGIWNSLHLKKDCVTINVMPH